MHYDAKPTINLDLLSLGVHRLWKRRVIELSGVKPGDWVLDISLKDTLLAERFGRIVSRQGHVVQAHLDPILALQRSEKLYQSRTLYNPVQISPNFQHLPWTGPQFDIVCMSFCLFSDASIGPAIENTASLLKPGGRLLLLDFAGDSHLRTLQQKVDNVVGEIVGELAGDSNPKLQPRLKSVSQGLEELWQNLSDRFSPLTKLLGETLTHTPLEQIHRVGKAQLNPSQVTTQLNHYGLRRCEHYPLSQGVFTLHRAFKP